MKEKPAPSKPEAPRAASAPAPPRNGAPRLEGAAEPTTEREALAGVLRREVNRRWAGAIVGVLLVPAVVIVGVLFARSRQIVPTGEREVAAAEAAVSQKRHLLEEGNRLLSDGKLEEAKKSFLELARVAPESSSAKEAILRVDRLLTRKAGRERVAAEVAQHLAAAKDAQTAGDLPRVAAEAETVLSLDPGDPEAVGLQRTAIEAIRRLPRAERRKAEARMKELRVGRPAVAAAPGAAASAPETVAGPPLHVILRSSVGSGTLFVRMNGAEVLRRSFGFGGRSGGLLEADVELPTGTGELRAWVFSADGTWRGYGSLRVDLAEGVRRSIILATGGDRNLSMALE